MMKTSSRGVHCLGSIACGVGVFPLLLDERVDLVFSVKTIFVQ
jgi:hypothetical protein